MNTTKRKETTLNVNYSKLSILPVLLVWFALLTSITTHGKDAFDVRIDASVQPDSPELSPLPGDIPRPVAAMASPDGQVEQFVVDEVILKPQDDQELDDFLARYDGALLHDGSLPEPPDAIPLERVRKVEPSPYRLVRVNLDYVDLSQLEEDAMALGVSGKFTFSSKDGMKLAALLFRSVLEGMYAAPEMVFTPDLMEHPDGSGGVLRP